LKELAILQLLIQPEVKPATRIGWRLGHFAKHGAAFVRWLQVELVIAGESDDPAVQVKRVLAKHLPEGELTPKARLTLHVLDEGLVSGHCARACVGFWDLT
jgi:hypothetical protein